MNEEENEELDPIEKELREAQEQYDRENQEIYDEVTKGNEEIRRKQKKNEEFEQLEIPFESRNLGRLGAGLTFEVGANTLLDALTLVPGSQAVGSAIINAIAQGIRGGKFSFGEVLGAAAASQIPGLAQGKAITKAGRITRAVGEGALSGAIDATSIAAVDQGRLPTAQELGLGIGAGGILGAGFQQAGEGAGALLQQMRNKVLKNQPITVMAMSPQKVATPGNIQQPKNTVISPFTGRALKQQKIGPYPSLPVNSRVIKVNTVEDAKDFVISRASNRKRKTIKTRGQKGPEIFEVTGGEQVMFDVDLRGESYISRRDQLITVPAVDVAQNSRYVLEQIPEDLEYYIRNVYDDEVFEQYSRYVKAGRNRLNVIKQEMQEEIKSIRADLVDTETGAISRPALIAPTQAKLEDSHILSVGRKGKLVKTGLTPGVQRVLQKSKVNRRSPSTFYGNMTKNFPSESRVYEPPAAYQSFIEFWKDNRARGAGSAFEGKDLQDAVNELRELGLPTSWLEDFFNFAIFDNLIASELNNKDIVKLLKQGYSAEAIFQQRLRKLNREMQLLDVYDFQDSIRNLPVSEQVRLIDERYRKEILAGTNIATFLDPPEKVPGTE
jgi:hypothetical protein